MKTMRFLLSASVATVPLNTRVDMSARLVSAVTSVPATNPAWTAMVSQARQPASSANSPAIWGAAAVAENHSVMPRISAIATSSSIRRGRGSGIRRLPWTRLPIGFNCD